MIERRQEIDTLHGLLKRHPVVGIIGARQVGKTTLARFFVEEAHQKSSYFDLESHPKVGASWEGFLLQQVIRRLQAFPEECYFWAAHGGAELDLFVLRGRRRYGFEFKRTTSPRVTPSMRSALSDLKLNRLDVIHAGEESFPLGEKIRLEELKSALLIQRRFGFFQ
jgi:predicted AAA+ superfamily ATPase